MHIPLEKYFARDSASIDWCEPNYVHSNHIAEFWNSLSSSLLLIYPVIMLLVSSGYRRFFTSKSYGTWLIHCTIGVASIYYHATLSLAGQLVDEIAILWVLVYTMAIWLPASYYEKYMSGSAFRIGCSVTGVLVTFLAMLSPILNAFCLMGIAFPYAYIVVSEVIRFNIPLTNSMCKRVALWWAAGVTVWAVERATCDFWLSVGFPYLHSLWHCCIAVAGHEVSVIAMYFHSIEQWKDLDTEMAFWPKGFPRHFSIPYVKMTPKESNNNVSKNHSTYVHNGFSNGSSRITKRF